MTTHPRRRLAGFTLIELLVVIAILGVLSALGAGAYFRIRTGQQLKNTEETVSKIEAGFQSLWKAELDEARDAFLGKKPGFSVQVDTVKALADNDQDRAKAVWTYIWMRRAFPQTFTEATTPITITTTPSVTMPVLTTFTSPAFTALAAPANTQADEAAVILYRLLTTKGSRGQVFGNEAIGALSKPLPDGNTAGQRVFTDTFGNAITYQRMSSGNGELDAPPFTKAASNNDPFDPPGRLTAGTWTPANKTTSLTAAGRAAFNGTNWLPTIISRGSAPDWGTLATASPTTPALVPNGFTAGYKLRRQGARGDQ